MCFSLPLSLSPLSVCAECFRSVKCVLSFGQVEGKRGEGGSWGGHTFPHFSPTLPMANFLARCEFYEQVCNEISVSCGRHSVYWQALVCPTLNIGSLKLLWVSFVRIFLPLPPLPPPPPLFLSPCLANHSARSHYAREVSQKTEQLKVKKLPKLWQNYCFSFVQSLLALYG